MTARLLFTGSRTLGWDVEPLIRDLILAAWGRHGRWDDPPILVSGACPHGKTAPGGDLIAERVAEDLGMVVERHPADWSAPCQVTCRPGHRHRTPTGRSTCPAAGLYRSDRMVALGASECIAVIRNRSRGARHCADAARAAGILLTRRDIS